MAPWFFALDHHNYSRWLPIHIRDMTNLHTTHPDVFRQFKQGNFVVWKTCNRFSGMSIDQAHEQNNALVKGEGGAIGLTENAAALRRWTVGGPEMARVIVDFESAIDCISSTRTQFQHHEEHEKVQSTFVSDVKKLAQSIQKGGNPFDDETSELVVLFSGDIIDNSVMETLYKINQSGIEQYNTFVNERIINRSKPLSDPIKKNNFPLISRPTVKKSTVPTQVSSLKQDCNLFARLYIASQSREGSLEEFFSHENQAYPPALSQFRKLRPSNKSQLLNCLEDFAMPSDAAPEVDAVMLDGPAVVHFLTPRNCRTFAEYASKIFLPFIQRTLTMCDRLDLVWDVYHQDSLKSDARTKRGTGARRRVAPGNTVPRKWSEFLKNSMNKTELFQFLSDMTVSLEVQELIVVTLGTRALTNKEESDVAVNEISPCTHEEADTRLLLHTANAVRHGSQKISIRTVDTDVVVLATAHFATIKPQELWIDFGTGKTRRFIPVHELAMTLGPQRCTGLPLFHSITGCDTVSAMYGVGKKKAWQHWQTYDHITTTFASLSSNPPQEISDSHYAELERFVVLLYNRTSASTEVNDVRRVLFTQKGRTIENIPPTQAALTQHVRRAVYQGGHIWGQALIARPEYPDPSSWGWNKKQSGTSTTWTPLWSTLPPASATCIELLCCGCTKGCHGRCKCRNNP